MSCKVGNQTNSQDPQAVNSRVFVGNLNTFQCSKTDVERMFQRYGRIAGISMHKGYAFIQFTNPFDARSACLGEDGRLLWGQTLDVNMVAEPKAHQTGRKRQNMAKTGNDWDYYYDSYYAQVGFPTPRLVPPMKRARLHVPPNATPRPIAKPSSPNKPYPTNNASLGELKSYSTPDILICGNCRELFTEIEQLMEHKKNYCKLRFTCKCHMLNGCKPKTPGEEPASLLCSQCKDSFHSAWDLMVHVQAAHMLNIYQLSSTENPPSNGTSGRDLHEGRDESGSEGALSLTIGNGNNGDQLEDSCSSLLHGHSHSHPHLQIVGGGSQQQSHQLQAALHHQQLVQQASGQLRDRSTSPQSCSSTGTGEGCSPTGFSGDSSLNLNEILKERRGTPERVINGNIMGNATVSCSHTSTSTASTTTAFPMEASTQTHSLHMDNPNNFEEHCSLLAAIKAEVNNSKHGPISNGQPAGI